MSNYFHAIYGQGGAPAPEPVDLSPVLLWTNPSPTSAFAGQKVSLALTEYAGVIIEYNLSGEIASTISRVYVKKSDNLNPSSGFYFGSGCGSNRGISRGISVVDNEGITFLNGVDGITQDSSASIIPVKIYGVKEYVVEPVGTQMKISASSNNGTENYGNFNIVNCKFNKLKIISYDKIENSFAGYPKITVGETMYERPSVGTVIDVLNKNVEIAALASNSGYKSTGILVEFL